MTQIISYAVPAELWHDQPRAPGALDIIQDLTQELMAIRRRLQKQVNEDAERDRFQETCELLEEAVLKVSSGDKNQFPKFINGGDYFELLAHCWLSRLADDGPPVDPWLGTSVIPPENVAEHIAALERAPNFAPHLEPRIAFLREAVQQKAGIVECQAEHAADTANLSLAGHLKRRVEGRIDLDVGHDGHIDVEAIFRKRIEQALVTGESVNMNNQNHVAITRVLVEFITVCDQGPSGQIRVAYGDGSEAVPFPLRCLQPADPKREEFVVPLSLMSMRHLLLDKGVVRNWLRNREIDQNSTLARADIYCHQHAIAVFRSLRRQVEPGQRLRIHLFHTGYEPAVVGVYRAAVEAIRDGGDWLRIVPHYYVDSGFVTGPSWPPLASKEN